MQWIKVRENTGRDTELLGELDSIGWHKLSKGKGRWRKQEGHLESSGAQVKGAIRGGKSHRTQELAEDTSNGFQRNSQIYFCVKSVEIYAYNRPSKSSRKIHIMKQK